MNCNIKTKVALKQDSSRSHRSVAGVLTKDVGNVYCYENVCKIAK